MKNTLQPPTFYIQRACFSELKLVQFYALAKLRQDVFIVEQQSIYVDLDGMDSEALHFLCWSSSQADAQLIAYARYRVCDTKAEIKIERVVLPRSARGMGLGKCLMREVLQDIVAKYPDTSISLSSQVTAQAFYQRLGFVAQGTSYDDGGIEHITMYYGF